MKVRSLRNGGRVLSFLGVFGVLLCIAAGARATSTVYAKFQSVSPSGPVEVWYGSTYHYSHGGGAGVYKYQVDLAKSDPVVQDLDLKAGGILAGFCVDLGQYVTTGSSAFTLVDLDDAPQPSTVLSHPMGSAKAALLSDYWYRYGPVFGSATWAGYTDAGHAQAFQIGIWEIIYEDAGNPLDVAAGQLRFKTSAITDLSMLNGWLASVDGSNASLVDLRALVNGSHQDVLVQLSVPTPQPPTHEVPEPMTVGAVAAGVAGLAGYLRRRRAARI